VNLSALYKELRKTLSESDARYVLRKRADLTPADIIAAADKEMEHGALALILADLNAVQDGKPLSRIYKEREFWGLTFEISEGTLDPRQDTETLIGAVLERYRGAVPPKTILDLGTGSGCILLSLLHEFPEARGIGIDLSEDAIKTAQKNAKNLGIGARATFMNEGWSNEFAESLDKKVDLVVSNPPYISNLVIPNLDENVRKYDPILALDGGEDGLQAYREIFSLLPHLLKRGGYGFFEIGFDQDSSVTRLGKESRFLVKSVHLDSQGCPRVVEFFLNK